MLISQINPYVRYAKYLNLNENSIADELVALDVRLFYAIEGYGKIKVGSAIYEMSKHSLLIINSGVPYKILTPEIPVSYIQINFDYTWKASSFSVPVIPVAKNCFNKEMLLDFNTFDDCETLSNVLYIKNFDLVHNRLTSIVSEYMQKLLYYRQKMGHILADCITDCIRHTEVGILQVQNPGQNMVLSYIHSHYSENLTNASIGKHFGYHPNYVSYLIKKLTGLPIHRYIIRIRLENAASLLVDSGYSISEIASLTGFCDGAYFSGCFKKQYGVNPSEYRNI